MSFQPTAVTVKLMDSDKCKASKQEMDVSVVASVKTEKPSKVLTLSSLPKPLVDMEYAVRGVIVSRAEDIKRELKVHPEKFTKFNEIIAANIGNPQAVGQKPITFNRQVLAYLLNPALLEEDYRDCTGRTQHSALSMDSTFGVEHDDLESLASTIDLPSFPFPEDVRIRAQKYLDSFPSFGSYSHSKGIQIFRREIATWFERRDGYRCDPESIFLTDGASSAIRMILELLVSGPSDGILIPIPQYPLYSASITRLSGTAIPYYLVEENGWKLNEEELQRAVDEARAKGVTPKAIAVINPGNPTGSLLREDEMRTVINFCAKEKILIMADEVYQNNVYCEDAKFISFRKMMKSMRSTNELVSFHSSSKGLGGECGVRGGLLQLENIDSGVVDVLYKLACVALCANTMGQAMLTCLLTPPTSGQPSFELYTAETQCIYNSLKRKAHYATRKFNEFEGVVCQPIDAAMYAFPKVTLPQKAIEAAQKAGVEPDMLYCMEMLEECGVVSVPGSGFVQAPGTYHFRTTILPSEDKFAQMLHAMHKFHNKFLQKYGVEVTENATPSPPPMVLVPRDLPRKTSSGFRIDNLVASVIKSPPV